MLPVVWGGCRPSNVTDMLQARNKISVRVRLKKGRDCEQLFFALVTRVVLDDVLTPILCDYIFPGCQLSAPLLGGTN